MASAPLPWLPLTLLLATSSLAPGCNTGAIGIKECREVEYARCEAAPACEVGEIRTDDDVAACKRFYKDQCLHGIAGSTLPTAQVQKNCVDAINAAAACAREDKAAEPSTCEDLPLDRVSRARAFSDVCDVIGRPWDLQACEYLESAPDDGAGGSKG